MEYLKPIHLLGTWILNFLGFKSTQKKEKIQRVIDYIDTCLEHMHIIMGYKENESVEIEQSRKFLQGAHQDIASHLGDVASSKECDIIKKSLMSARIYFHAIDSGESADEQIRLDYQERYETYLNNPYTTEEYRQNSYEVYLKRFILDNQPLNINNISYERTRIKEVCQEDIARIELLKEQLKTRKIA